VSSLVYLVPLALLLGGAALAAFLWSLRSGQYEDLDGAAHRIFLEDDGDRAGGGPDAGATARVESDDSMSSPR
jgi:cbb3-type cytochrome oxidase maturation protein